MFSASLQKLSTRIISHVYKFALGWNQWWWNIISPICIVVMNTNNCGAETQCCIGYMPKVPDQVRAEFAKTTDSTTMKFHIRQQCCRAILRVLESAATRGVICTLPNRIDKPVDRLLFPRLIAMNFDQPEAQLFFGDDAPLPVPSCSHMYSR